MREAREARENDARHMQGRRGMHIKNADVADLLERHLLPISLYLDTVKQRCCWLFGTYD